MNLKKKEPLHWLSFITFHSFSRWEGQRTHCQPRVGKKHWRIPAVQVDNSSSRMGNAVGCHRAVSPARKPPKSWASWNFRLSEPVLSGFWGQISWETTKLMVYMCEHRLCESSHVKKKSLTLKPQVFPKVVPKRKRPLQWWMLNTLLFRMSSCLDGHSQKTEILESLSTTLLDVHLRFKL